MHNAYACFLKYTQNFLIPRKRNSIRTSGSNSVITKELEVCILSKKFFFYKNYIIMEYVAKNMKSF